jgi:hypothetical protein
MVRVVCTPREPNFISTYDKSGWLCSIDGGPRFEARIKILTSKGEHIIIPEDDNETFMADAEIVIVNRNEGYIKIWQIR